MPIHITTQKLRESYFKPLLLEASTGSSFPDTRALQSSGCFSSLLFYDSHCPDFCIRLSNYFLGADVGWNETAVHNSILALQFVLRHSLYYRLEGQPKRVMAEGQYNMIASPDAARINWFDKSNSHTSTLDIQFSTAYLQSLARLFPELVTLLEKRERGMTMQLGASPATCSPMMMRLLKAIIECDLVGDQRRCYMVSKVHLILLQALEQLASRPAEKETLIHLKRYDLEKIHEAREYLFQNMENPPTFKELAHKVGINDYKLKKGYRQVFGTTIFGDFHRHRKTANSGEIKLSPVLPAVLNQLRIPNSICYGAAGSFGHVLFQELGGENISVLYHTLYFTEDVQVTYKSYTPSIRLQIILRNSYFYESKAIGPGVLHERGMSLNYFPSIHTVLQLRKQETYNHVAIYYKKEHLLQLVSSFPKLQAFLGRVNANKAMQFNEHYTIADANILSLVDCVVNCPNKDPLQQVVVDTMAKEILLMSLFKMAHATTGAHIPIGEAEAVYIYRAKELILEELGNPLSMPTLAKRIGISIYKLNNGFKGIYGMGVNEFQLEVRMLKAHQVLSETDTPVSVVAKNSGYSHHHAFEHAFKKFFGYSPAFVHKSTKIKF